MKDPRPELITGSDLMPSEVYPDPLEKKQRRAVSHYSTEPVACVTGYTDQRPSQTVKGNTPPPKKPITKTNPGIPPT